MFKFITNRPFWVNLLAAIVLALLLLFLFLKTLGWLTRHGEYLKVPAVTGMKTDEAVKLLEKQGFDVYIQDSVFTDTAARGIVLKQLPDPNSTVKINRTVFITVNRMVPPMIEMPNLEGQNLSFALNILERNHLKLADTVFRPDFMAGSVLEQQYNGVRIKAKSKIQWGSSITLVVGSGPVGAVVLMGVLILLAIPFRFLIGWVFHRTGSLFVVGLVHAMGNAATGGSGFGEGMLPRLYPGRDGVPFMAHLITFAVLGLIVVIATRGRLGTSRD